MRKGFTLIELLVVVLIIGILAAIALPQYERAVWRSRAAQPLQLVRDLSLAQERHFLANNSYSADFTNLDIDFPSLPITSGISTFGWITDKVIGNNDMALIVNPSSYGGRVMAFLRNGKFAGGTFSYFLKHGASDNGGLKRGQIYCAEVYNPSSAAAQEGFCKKVMGITAAPVSFASAYYYPMS